MEAASDKDLLKMSIVRTLVVALASIAIGVLFFHSNVFIPTMRASQFLSSGITAALVYAALKVLRPRDGMAALLVWYLVLTLLLVNPDSWLFILAAVYVVGIASAVYVYDLFARKNFVRGLLQHVAAMGVLTGLANGVIVLILFLIGTRDPHTFTSGRVYAAAFENLQLGSVIGIALGFGMQLAEFLLGLPFVRKTFSISPLPSSAEAPAPGTPDGVQATSPSFVCPSCGEELELSPRENESHQVTCPTCGKTTEIQSKAEG
jgi:predicted RNA-binding Zn-ribbon protein involved in translation (DUF1610 family)